jgi:hypothetical protein
MEHAEATGHLRNTTVAGDEDEAAQPASGSH